MNNSRPIFKRVVIICAVTVFATITAPINAQQILDCPRTTPSGVDALLEAAANCLTDPVRNANSVLEFARAATAQLTLDDARLVDAYRLQADAHMWLRQYGQSIAWRTLAIALDPTNADDYARRAGAMSAIDDIEGAYSDQEQAIALDPNNVDRYLSLADYLLDNDDTERALDVISRAVVIAPENAAVRQILGDVYYAQQTYAQARNEYEQYLLLTNNVSPVVRARLLVIERRLGN